MRESYKISHYTFYLNQKSMAIALHLHTFVATVSSSGGGIRGFPPLPEKLTCPPTSPQLFCLQNVDFAIAMPFIGRFSEMFLPTS